MKEFPHENIVQFHESYLVGEELWVVMEHMEDGALTGHLHKTRYVLYIPHHVCHLVCTNWNSRNIEVHEYGVDVNYIKH